MVKRSLQRHVVLPVPPRGFQIDAAMVVNAVSTPIFVVDGAGCIHFVNSGCEQFFDASAAFLVGHFLGDLIPADSPLFSLIAQSLASGASLSEHGVTLESPRIGKHLVAIQVSPIGELPNCAVVALHERSITHKIDSQLNHRSAARSVTAMAAMLAHEVKNPLSGIRGAAQLLEQTASEEDHELTRLICDETDRICALVDRMDVFSGSQPMDRTAVNIHQVLEHVRKIAQAGFAKHVRFIEAYDPSLPSVYGNRDQLVQVFLNLVKNAAEAVPAEGGEIILSTAYQHGIRLAVPGTASRMHLPLVVRVQDNGDGIPEDLWPHLFDPFVTTKANGSGLGLALVAKIIGDHGGVIEFDSQPRRTVFRVMLPKHTEENR